MRSGARLIRAGHAVRPRSPPGDASQRRRRCDGTGTRLCRLATRSRRGGVPARGRHLHRARCARDPPPQRRTRPEALPRLERPADLARSPSAPAHLEVLHLARRASRPAPPRERSRGAETGTRGQLRQRLHRNRRRVSRTGRSVVRLLPRRRPRGHAAAVGRAVRLPRRRGPRPSRTTAVSAGTNVVPWSPARGRSTSSRLRARERMELAFPARRSVPPATPPLVLQRVLQVRDRGVQVFLARATLGSEPADAALAPGRWRRYFEGAFSEPGIGGEESPVLSGRALDESNARFRGSPAGCPTTRRSAPVGCSMATRPGGATRCAAGPPNTSPGGEFASPALATRPGAPSRVAREAARRAR